MAGAGAQTLNPKAHTSAHGTLSPPPCSAGFAGGGGDGLARAYSADTGPLPGEGPAQRQTWHRR